MKSIAPHECLHCSAACLPYPNSFLREHGIRLWDTNWDTNCDLFNPHKDEYHDYLVFILLDSILGCYWYIFMSRYKLATLPIPLSKRQQWHKPTRSAVMITTHLSRLMPPVNNTPQSCYCNLALIDCHAPYWKVGGVFSGVMDGMTRMILGGKSCFNGR